jgi:hypothetical protein
LLKIKKICINKNYSNSETLWTTIAISIFFIYSLYFNGISNSFAQSIKNDSSKVFSPKLHEIEMAVTELPDERIAYKMDHYMIKDLVSNQSTDITSRYNLEPTIPGPIIVVNEGDKVKITLLNDMGWGNPSIHTHGAHYTITSDGTIGDQNKVGDEAASPTHSYTYEWEAGNDTAGSWPFHDHTLGLNSLGKSMHGLETIGLFSSIIINPSNGKVNALINNVPTSVNVSDIKKDYILFVNDDVFWGSEIDYTKDGKHKALGINPTLTATNNSIVRFNIQSTGNDFHNFTTDNIKWLQPGTEKVINSHEIGPLANLVFTVQLNKNASYFDSSKINLLGGMKGKIIVIANPTDNNNTTTSTSLTTSDNSNFVNGTQKSSK